MCGRGEEIKKDRESHPCVRAKFCISMRESEGVSYNHIDKSCHYSLDRCHMYLIVRYSRRRDGEGDKVEAQKCFTIELLFTTRWRENHHSRTKKHEKNSVTKL